MVKEVHYTKITPLPSNVPRLLALDLLHSHDEWIRLNPLVTGVEKIDAPRTAESDEYFSDWYMISEIITWGLGLKKKLAFKGCFHNQPWGMQSHVFAPMGVEFRNTYRIGGNQPGEPRETRELGVNTPADGLYLREDISFTCQVPLVTGFVKKEMQAASQVMIDRMSIKAELLDEGKLHAMFIDGKLKTSKASRTDTFYEQQPTGSPKTAGPSGSDPSPMASPNLRHSDIGSPGGFSRYDTLVGRNQSIRNSYGAPHQEGYQGPGADYARPGAERQTRPAGHQHFVAEMPGSYYYSQQGDLIPQPLKPAGQQQGFRAELPGEGNLQPPPAQGPPPNAVRPAQQAVAYDSRQVPPQNGTQPQPQAQQYPNGSQSQYQAYQAPNRSSQPSPALTQPSTGQSNRGSTSGNSGYQVVNPESQGSPRPDAPRQVSNQSVQAWQQSVQNDTPIEESYYRNSRSSHGGQLQPDNDRMSKMSIQDSTDDRQGLPSRSSNCPVCGAFEGDEAAVSHHVTKAHFPQT